MTREEDLPPEFDLLRNGYTMRGWDFTRAHVAAAIRDHRMLNPAFELGTNICPWNCGFCFTEDPDNSEGVKRRLVGEMALEERLHLLSEARLLGAESVNFIGAGEPTIDPYFWEIVEHMAVLGITPIIYTEGALKLTDRRFVDRLYEVGATVVLKVNSLRNEDYQNAIVAGPVGRKRSPGKNYFQERAVALRNLIAAGFNRDTPTRLAFDTIVCDENRAEIADLHRYGRRNNIFILFVNYLPSGRSTDPLHGALTRTQQFALFDELRRIDEQEFSLVHRAHFPYAGGTPCTIRGLGLYVKIRGDAFDCPGESERLGNIRETSLATLWERLRPVTEGFDGGCHPRDLFWREHPEMQGSDARRHLPILP